MKPLRKLYTNSHYPLKLVYTEQGNPVDITGFTAKLVVRRTIYSSAAFTKEATIDGPTGSITFVIEPSDTQDILGEDDSANFLIGAVMQDPDGKVFTLFQSQIEIHENIVRD